MHTRFQPSQSSAQLSTNEQQYKQQGFNLVELIVVIAIIAILGTIVVTNLSGEPEKARIAATKLSMKSITTSLEIYNIENGSYPTTSQGIAATSKTVPTDSWGEEFVYIGNGDSYILYSKGPKKEDDADDIKPK